MRIIIFFLLMSVCNASFSQGSTSNQNKEKNYLCEVKLNLVTKKAESLLISDQENREFKSDSVKMKVLSELKKKTTATEILFLFLQDKWHLISSVYDCQSSGMVFYFKKSTYSSVGKKTDTVIIDSRKRML